MEIESDVSEESFEESFESSKSEKSVTNQLTFPPISPSPTINLTTTSSTQDPPLIPDIGISNVEDEIVVSSTPSLPSLFNQEEEEDKKKNEEEEMDVQSDLSSTQDEKETSIIKSTSPKNIIESLEMKEDEIKEEEVKLLNGKEDGDELKKNDILNLQIENMEERDDEANYEESNYYPHHQVI